MMAALKILSVLACIHAISGAECDAGNGGCASSLVQVKRAQDVAHFDMHEAASTHASRQNALLGFQKYAEDLVMKSLAHNTSLSEDEMSAIDTIIAFVEGFFSNLLLEQDTDLWEIEQCNVGINECADTRNVDTVTTIYNNMIDLKGDHSECRVNESLCDADLNAECLKYDNCRKDVTPGCQLPPCAPADFDYDTYMTALEGTAELATMELCLEQTYAWLNVIYPLYEECDRLRDLCPSIKEGCDCFQHNFENTAKDFAAAHDQVCTNYRTCWDNAQNMCDTYCANVAVSVAARKADNETAERVLCLIKIFELSNDLKPQALDDCRAKTYDTSSWDLTCPNANKPTEFAPLPSPLPDCDHTSAPPYDYHEPCDATWIAQEYDGTEAWKTFVVDCGTASCPTVAPAPSP